jgi:hypothetical protein
MATNSQTTSSTKVHYSNVVQHFLESYYDKYIHCEHGILKNGNSNENTSNILGKFGLTMTKENCRSKYD